MNFVNKSIDVPNVPSSTNVNIKFVPSGNVEKTLQVGGTSPPILSFDNTTNLKYRIRSPYKQNTLEPVLTNNTFINPKNKVCINTYSRDQNVIGKVCNSVGTRDILHTGIHTRNIGNANWVRGNEFSSSYNEQDINNPNKYYINSPTLEENKNKIVIDDLFYPNPKKINDALGLSNNPTIDNSVQRISSDPYDRYNIKMYKDYPSQKKFIDGLPYWENSNIQIPKNKITEEYTNYTILPKCNYLFWIGIVIIVCIDKL